MGVIIWGCRHRFWRFVNLRWIFNFIYPTFWFNLIVDLFLQICNIISLGWVWQLTTAGLISRTAIVIILFEQDFFWKWCENFNLYLCLGLQRWRVCLHHNILWFHSFKQNLVRCTFFYLFDISRLFNRYYKTFLIKFEQVDLWDIGWRALSFT